MTTTSEILNSSIGQQYSGAEELKTATTPRLAPPPYLAEVEQAVLSAIFRSDGKLFAVATAANITRESFYRLEYQRIYSAMVDVAQAGEKPDAVAVGAGMSRDDQELIASLYDAIAGDDGFESWLVMLKEMEAVRKILDAAMKFSDECSGNIKPKDALAAVSRLAKEMADGQAMIEKHKVMSLEKLFEEAGKWEPEATIPYFPKGTEGYSQIQHCRGEMHVISANTGAGKTALAAGAVRQQLEAGLVVAYFCFESDSVAIMRRIAAQFCGIPHYIMREASSKEDKRNRFKATLAELKEKYSGQIFVRGSETGINSPEGIRAELGRIVHEAGHVDVVVIDFLQFMQVPKFLATKSKLEQVNYCIEKLHSLFIEFHAAGIVLTQINRAGQQALGENERPGMEHIKDSSVIAQLAHTVSFLRHRKDKDGNITITELYSEKTRDQEHFNLKLTWNDVGYESKSESKNKGKRYSSDDIPPAESNGGGPEGRGDRGNAPDCI